MNTVLQEALDSPRAIQQDDRPVSGFRQGVRRIESFLSSGLSADRRATPPPYHAPAVTLTC